ncbi:protein cornichon homolog 2 isoform X2 [Notamacropus eugenii]|uniref:protein cornichon homolog 2 isoform X2 n=1 Tax=Notamacropus eugenii TaxID=9315 RepID=UPI003B66E133
MEVFPPPCRRLRGHVRRRLHHERRHPQLLSEGVLVQTGLLPALLLLLSVQYGLYVGEFLKGEAGQGVKPENGPDSCVPHPRGPLGQQRTSSAPAPPNCCYGMARPSPPPHLGPCQSGASQRPPAAAPTWKAYYYGRDLESSPALGLTGRQERDRARERGTGPLPLPEQATNHPFGPFPATPGRPPGFGKLAREAEPRGGEGREQAQPGAPPQPHLPLPALPLPFPPSLFSALSSVFPLCHAPRPRPCLSLYPGFLRRWGSGPFQRLGEFVCKTQVSLGQSWPFVTE